MHKLCLIPIESIKKDSILYIVCIGGTGQSQPNAIMQWDEVSTKLIEQCYTKGTQEISSASQAEHTAALGASEGKAKFPETETLTLLKCWP